MAQVVIVDDTNTKVHGIRFRHSVDLTILGGCLRNHYLL